MNFKTTYILFGLLLAVVAVFGLVLWLNPVKPPDETYVLSSVHDPKDPIGQKDIDTVEIQRNRPEGKKIVFVRDKDSKHWRMTAPYEVGVNRVDDTVVNHLIEDCLGARRDENADVTNDLKTWELDPPAVVITLKKGDRAWEVDLGKKAETRGGETSGVYVSSSDHRNEVMRVPLNRLDIGFKALNEFRARSLLAQDAGKIQSLTLEDGTHKPVILSKISGTRWRFAQPAGYGEADYGGEQAIGGGKATPGIHTLLDILTQMRVDYKSEKENDFVAEQTNDLGRYGLEPGKKSRLEITVAYEVPPGEGSEQKQPASVTDTLIVGSKADDKGDKYYAMLKSQQHGGEADVVKVAGKNVEELQRALDNPGSLRDPALAHLEDFRVDAVVVKNDKGTLELFKPSDSLQWKLYRGDQNANAAGQNADEEAVRGLLSGLAGKLDVAKYPDPDPEKSTDKALGLDQPVAVLSVWEDGLQKEEKKPEDKKDSGKEPEKKETKPKLKSDKPNVKLTFGKTNAEQHVVYVKRETPDEPTPILLAVPDTLLDRVKEGPLAYLDRSLPSFTGVPSKLTLERNGQKYVLEKDKSSWKLVEPKELASRAANQFTLEQMVNNLHGLQAEQLIAEKATPELEKQYGLATPKVRATVTVPGKDNKPEDVVYTFGDEVKDKTGQVTGVYARESKSDAIFTVRKATVDFLQSELRDPFVFHFDPTKVKELKLTGWQDLTGNPLTLDLQQEAPGKWVIDKQNSTVSMELDPAKVEDLLTRLSNLRIEQYLDPKTGPKPEKLDLNSNALHMWIVVEGEKEPLVLTLQVGGETADKKDYFASSSQLPDEFFLVSKEPFEKVRVKPTEFEKQK